MEYYKFLNIHIDFIRTKNFINMYSAVYVYISRACVNTIIKRWYFILGENHFSKVQSCNCFLCLCTVIISIFPPVDLKYSFSTYCNNYECKTFYPFLMAGECTSSFQTRFILVISSLDTTSLFICQFMKNGWLEISSSIDEIIVSPTIIIIL